MAISRLVAEVRACCFTKREIRIRSCLWAFQRYECSSVPKGEGLEEMMSGFDETHGKDLQEEVSVGSSWTSNVEKSTTPLCYPEPMLLHIEPTKKKKGSLCRGEDKKLRSHVDASLNPSKVSLLEENLSKVLDKIKLTSQCKETSIIEKLEKLQKLDEKVQKIDQNVEKFGEDATGLIDVVNLRDQETQSRLKRLEECAFSSLKEMAKLDAEFLNDYPGLATIQGKLTQDIVAIHREQVYSYIRVWEEMERLQDGMTTMEQRLNEGVNVTNTQQTDSFQRVWEEMKRLQDGMTTIQHCLRGGVEGVYLWEEELKRLQDGITKIEQSLRENLDKIDALSEQKQVRLSSDVKESSSGKDRADVFLVAISSGFLACSMFSLCLDFAHLLAICCDVLSNQSNQSL